MFLEWPTAKAQVQFCFVRIENDIDQVGIIDCKLIESSGVRTVLKTERSILSHQIRIDPGMLSTSGNEVLSSNSKDPEIVWVRTVELLMQNNDVSAPMKN